MAFFEYEGKPREIAVGELIIGSGSQSTWRLQNTDLAARHFSVLRSPDGPIRVRPHSTQNIVVVNGRAVGVEPVTLADGDVVAAGSAKFLFMERADGERPAGWDKPAGAAFLVDGVDRKAYPLVKKSVNIGRDAASQVLLKDPSVSRFHADVKAEAGQHVLYSMGSAGTTINGRRVSGPQLLEEGDKIEVGGSTLVFTRQALPQGMEVVRGGLDEGDKSTRRQTQLYQKTIETGETAKLSTGGPPMKMILIGVIVVLAIAVAVLLLR